MPGRRGGGTGLTDERAHELAVAVQKRRHAGQARVEVIAALEQSLARGHLRAQRLAFRALGVVVDGVRALARPVGDARILHVRVREPIAEHDRCEVDVHDPGR